MSESLTPEIEALCASTVQNDASDLLLHEGRPPQLRIDGALTPLDSPPLDGEFFDALWRVCGAADKHDYDASLTSSGSRFRVNLLHQLGLRAAVFRRIRKDVPDMETLGVPADLLREWCARPSGLLLVCGPTGSGKSTTLASALEWMNGAMARHIVTIEDPIEFLFAGRMSLFTQREVGIDTASFAEGLRRSLRQNPDVIFVGEIRDAATATTAIQAAETGHLVMATLHSSSCADAVERLQLYFPMDERDAVRKTLAAQLLAILCQRLLPAVDGGRVLATEYFTNVGAIKQFVADGRLPELADLMARSDPRSARSFLSTLAQLVRDGKITEETACSSAENPQEMLRSLRGISSSSQSTRR